jgi:phage terminase large subunit
MIDLQYAPREPFLDFHQRHQRNALMACHRRMGKTVACVGDLVVRALHTKKPDARYGYVAPFRQQAKEIAWVYLKNMTDGLRIEAPREAELRVKLPNGAWVTIYGADNPNSLRGLYFDGLILDEFGDMKPSLMGEVIIPCLADRQGWLVLIGTVKGRNNFYDYMVKAQSDSANWFYKMAKASETGIIPEHELDRMKQVMGDAQYAQEMECDVDAALPGTYYTDMINRLQADGRIQSETLYEPTQQVYVAADVGLRDSTAWWFWQPRPEGIAIIDHYEASGMHIDHYLGMLHEKGYEYAEIWLPHDAKAKTLATRRSTVEQFVAPSTVRPDLYGPGDRLPIRIVPKLAIQHGIDAVRLMLPNCYFDFNRTAKGLDALRMYRRQYHEHTKQFADTPLHDWASNSADGFRYLAIVANKSRAVTAQTQRPSHLPDGVGIAQRNSNGLGYSLNELWADNDRKWKHKVIRL